MKTTKVRFAAVSTLTLAVIACTTALLPKWVILKDTDRNQSIFIANDKQSIYQFSNDYNDNISLDQYDFQGNLLKSIAFVDAHLNLQESWERPVAVPLPDDSFFAVPGLADHLAWFNSSTGEYWSGLVKSAFGASESDWLFVDQKLLTDSNQLLMTISNRHGDDSSAPETKALVLISTEGTVEKLIVFENSANLEMVPIESGFRVVNSLQAADALGNTAEIHEFDQQLTAVSTVATSHIGRYVHFLNDLMLSHNIGSADNSHNVVDKNGNLVTVFSPKAWVDNFLAAKNSFYVASHSYAGYGGFNEICNYNYDFTLNWCKVPGEKKNVDFYLNAQVVENDELAVTTSASQIAFTGFRSDPVAGSVMLGKETHTISYSVYSPSGAVLMKGSEESYSRAGKYTPYLFSYDLETESEVAGPCRIDSALYAGEHRFVSAVTRCEAGGDRRDQISLWEKK